MSITALPQVSARRRNTDRVMRSLLLVATVIALVPLVLVIYYLLHKGLSTITGSGFFTTDPNGSFFGNHGGIRSALLGTLEIIGMASVISIVLGIGVALWLTEYGKDSWFANLIRYFVDVMTGVPSIVFGLFIYITLVVTHAFGSSAAAWKGAIAVALLMLPVVIRASEVVLLLVPASLREAALALGAPRWRVIARVVLPTSLSGLITGSLLAVARGMGETAPLLFVVGAGTFGATADPNAPMNALPLQIFTDITSPQASVQARAWGAGLTLVLLVLILNVIARIVSRRSRMA